MNDAEFELIMAYADGETGPEDTARADALVADNAEARLVLARLRASDKKFRTGLDSVLDEPVPERLIRAATAQAPERGRLLRFPQKRRIGPSHWAMAASLVLALGVVMFWAGTPEPGTDTMRAFVYQTLEQTPSGERRADPERGWQVMPLASYETADGRLCREYAGRVGEDTLSGLACRTGDGQWQTLVSEAQAAAAHFQPASGPAGAVSAELESLQVGEPLTAQEEAVRLGLQDE